MTRAVSRARAPGHRGPARRGRRGRPPPRAAVVDDLPPGQPSRSSAAGQMDSYVSDQAHPRRLEDLRVRALPRELHHASSRSAPSAVSSCASRWRTTRRLTPRCAMFESAARANSTAVGIVLQSRLFRTEGRHRGPDRPDPNAARPLSVRMVKGIYLEPEEIAHTKPEPIREQVRGVPVAHACSSAGATVSFATHDA